jgi:hypothetical protein
MTPDERRRMIAARVAESPGWGIIHWLGSMRLALVLLATIAIACAVATFAESSFSAEVARAAIYKAPWFIVWLCVLCVNLFAVTLTRWPWEKKHAGFIITHYGIITLLVGAMIGMNWGFEGNVTLRKNAPPTTRVTVNRSVLQVESPDEGAFYVMPFDAATARLSEARPKVFQIPGSGLGIVADAFSGSLVREKSLSPADSGEPGVALRFTSALMGQSEKIAMLLDGATPQEENFFGLATIIFRPSLPDPVAATGTAAGETQLVFAKFAPVVHSGAAASGVRVLLADDGGTVTIIARDGTAATHPREGILKKPVASGTALVTVEEFWPDFEMRDGKPATKSVFPNNPAALVRVQSPGSRGKPSLVLAPSGDGVRYQLRRGEATVASGDAKPGDAFPLGWADWRAEVTAFYPKAAASTRTVPAPPNAPRGVPGFRARLESPDSRPGPARWIESGTITTLSDGVRDVRIGYGLELRPLPFSIRLVDFQVPRYEGTDTPSNFIATVEFADHATGEKSVRTARMNHPASFPGTAWANISGINYKFSQAGWNPRDPGETTLQVLYDPGWLFKWLGSLAICAGIAVMFYFTPRRAAKKSGELPTPETDA